MVAVDGKDRDRNVDIGIFVIDVWESTFEHRCSIGKKLQRTRLHAQAVLSEGSHDLVKGLSRGFVVVEEITGEKNHVDLTN